VVIITEKMIAKGVCDIIESFSVSGYTMIAAGGKGGHGIRELSDHAVVIDDFSGVRIEVILTDKNKAISIMQNVADCYFEDYAGITFLDTVEILRPNKF
jgi:hypothetical protein